MSSRIMLKITLTSVLFMAHLIVQPLSANRGLNEYVSGKCVGRPGHFPTTKCKTYLKCSGDRGEFKDCQNGTIFDITTKNCSVDDTTPPCKDVKKVNVFEWSNLDEKNKTILSQGKKPMPATKNESKSSFDNVSEHWNDDFNVLLQTSFLAVENGSYKFYSKCIPWCKVWIRKDICGTPELVLHQNTRRRVGDAVEYHVQKNYTMEFATFYYLDVVHIGNRTSDFQFSIGVEIPGEDDHPENIPPVLLRLPAERKCPQQSTTTTPSIYPSPSTIWVNGSLTPNTVSTTGSPKRTISNTGSLAPDSTKLWASTTKLGVLTSPTSSPTENSPPSAITRTSDMMESTPYRQSTTQSSSTTTTSLKSAIKDLLERTEKYLNKKTNNSSSQIQLSGMSRARDVDLKGEKIAESWNQEGKSFTVREENVEMEVSFPQSNYTFPSRNTSNKPENEFKFAQILIPVRALLTKKGEFKRKVFSALYYNLNTKIPQFFNVVEIASNQIPGSYQLNSHVIASTAVPKISGLPNHDIVIRLAHLQTNFSSEIKPLCVFFKWSNDVNSDGVWSTEGCKLDENLSNKNLSVCRCNHLTHFGVLMQVDTHQLGPKDVKALKIITYIGCALSLIGVSLTVLAILCLPGARSDRNFIHVNLAVAIGLAQVTFLAGIDETGHEVACTIVAAMLHYFLLVAFAWMLIEGIFLHILIVKVFHDHLPKKRFYVTFCWGSPLLIVLLSVGLLRDGYGTKTSCWLSTDKSTIWTFSGPAILVMIINIIILCKVMKEISSLRTSDQQDSNVRSVRYGVRSTIILLPLLGLTWAFGLICINESLTVFQYLFTIFNSLQGLFIFLFHCVFNTEVRKAFWRKVDIWFTNHNNPFANNIHSRSSFKKCKDYPSSISSPDHDKKDLQRNGLSMYSFNNLSERERRKLSTATASTCLDPWPHKLSLTPSLDGPSPSRFTPSLSSDDIKYQPIHKLDAGQKRISPKSIRIKVEDLNGNTKKVDNDSGLKEESHQPLANKDSQNGANSAENNEETNLGRNKLSTQLDGEQQENQNIVKSQSDEESYIQKESQHNRTEESNQNERTLNQTQENKKISKKPLRDSPCEKRTIGIGGQQMNSGDKRGEVTKIDVNDTFGSLGTKL